MKRLIKKSIHDWNNRDYAIVYFNGVVYEDATHGICLQRYIDDNSLDENIDLGNRPEIDQFKEISEINGGQDVILAHKVDNANEIYYIYGLNNGNEMTDNEIIEDLQKSYLNSKIINDLDHNDNDLHGYDEEEQVNKSSDRIYEFQMKKVNEVIKSEKLNHDEDKMIIYNDYFLIQYQLEDGIFFIRTMLDSGYNYDESISLSKLKEVINNVKNKLFAIYDEITKLGYKIYEDYLIENNNFSYNKIVNGIALELIGGPSEKEFIFTYECSSREIKKEFEQKIKEIGVKFNRGITLEQIKSLEKLF